MSAGIGQAGITASRGVATTTLYIDDLSYPVLNVAHTAMGGSINLSAGTNPGQSFNVQQTQTGNSQIFTGPNVLVSNVFQAPQTAVLGTANVGAALNVTGPSTLSGNTTVTGSFQTTGTANVSNILSVGNATITPILRANLITATGATANTYLETTSAVAGNNAGVYLGGGWNLKVLNNGGLAFQSTLNGQRVNSQVIMPSGASLTVGQLYGSTV